MDISSKSQIFKAKFLHTQKSRFFLSLIRTLSSPAIGQFRDQFVNRFSSSFVSSPLNLSVLGQFVRNEDLGTEMKIWELTYADILVNREFP